MTEQRRQYTPEGESTEQRHAEGTSAERLFDTPDTGIDHELNPSILEDNTGVIENLKQHIAAIPNDTENKPDNTQSDDHKPVGGGSVFFLFSALSMGPRLEALQQLPKKLWFVMRCLMSRELNDQRWQKICEIEEKIQGILNIYYGEGESEEKKQILNEKIYPALKKFQFVIDPNEDVETRAVEILSRLGLSRVLATRGQVIRSYENQVRSAYETVLKNHGVTVRKDVDSFIKKTITNGRWNFDVLGVEVDPSDRAAHLAHEIDKVRNKEVKKSMVEYTYIQNLLSTCRDAKVSGFNYRPDVLSIGQKFTQIAIRGGSDEEVRQYLEGEVRTLERLLQSNNLPEQHSAENKLRKDISKWNFKEKVADLNIKNNKEAAYIREIGQYLDSFFETANKFSHDDLVWKSQLLTAQQYLYESVFSNCRFSKKDRKNFSPKEQGRAMLKKLGGLYHAGLFATQVYQEIESQTTKATLLGEDVVKGITSAVELFDQEHPENRKDDARMWVLDRLERASASTLQEDFETGVQTVHTSDRTNPNQEELVLEQQQNREDAFMRRLLSERINHVIATDVAETRQRLVEAIRTDIQKDSVGSSVDSGPWLAHREVQDHVVELSAILGNEIRTLLVKESEKTKAELARYLRPNAVVEGARSVWRNLGEINLHAKLDQRFLHKQGWWARNRGRTTVEFLTKVVNVRSVTSGMLSWVIGYLIDAPPGWANEAVIIQGLGAATTGAVAGRDIADRIYDAAHEPVIRGEVYKNQADAREIWERRFGLVNGGKEKKMGKKKKNKKEKRVTDKIAELTQNGQIIEAMDEEDIDYSLRVIEAHAMINGLDIAVSGQQKKKNVPLEQLQKNYRLLVEAKQVFEQKDAKEYRDDREATDNSYGRKNIDINKANEYLDQQQEQLKTQVNLLRREKGILKDKWKVAAVFGILSGFISAIRLGNYAIGAHESGLEEAADRTDTAP